MFRSLVVLLTTAVTIAAAPVPKAKKEPTLDGTWELIRQNNNDNELPKLSPWKWEIKGEELYRHWGNGDGTFNREKQNCWLVRPEGGGPDDVDYVTDFARTSTYKARMLIDGDELVVCWLDGGVRPTELKPGPKVNYYRFKRVSDK